MLFYHDQLGPYNIVRDQRKFLDQSTTQLHVIPYLLNYGTIKSLLVKYNH